MDAGTIPCCAGGKILAANSTEKRSFVSAHPSRSIRSKEEEHRRVGTEILSTNCAGLDVHKKTVKVCLLTQAPNGQLHQTFRTDFTTTEEL
jgi:hypothetical protein